MSEDIQSQMRKELTASTKGFGASVGFFTFFALVTVTRNVIGFNLEAGDKEPLAWMLIFSVIVGYVAGKVRSGYQRQKVSGYDVDTLKYKHDELKRKELKSSIITYIVIALVVAYFLFKR